jgi:hypothetical protein
VLHSTRELKFSRSLPKQKADLQQELHSSFSHIESSSAALPPRARPYELEGRPLRITIAVQLLIKQSRTSYNRHLHLRGGMCITVDNCTPLTASHPPCTQKFSQEASIEETPIPPTNTTGKRCYILALEQKLAFHLPKDLPFKPNLQVIQPSDLMSKFNLRSRPSEPTRCDTETA